MASMGGQLWSLFAAGHNRSQFIVGRPLAPFYFFYSQSPKGKGKKGKILEGKLTKFFRHTERGHCEA